MGALKRVPARLLLVAGFLLASGVGLWLSLKNPITDEAGFDPESARVARKTATGTQAGYLDPAVCRPCHLQIYQTYQRTGMGRSLFRPRPEKMIEDWKRQNTFYHPASDRYYTMSERDGKYYQRRHQIGPGGREDNAVEKEIHFVVGSGNHARTYLHRSPDGKVVELPASWYSEKGGFWAMNPGYDRPDHDGFRRRITYACLFCHNAYPEIEPGSDSFGRDSIFTGRVPEGIDCQRCHGPGRAHIETMQKKDATVEEVRRSIVNPARLSSERQMEVCMQCHLETTSARLPNFIRRYERGAFSYRPGEPLGSYILHFDHAPGTGHEDKFEIVSAAYRLPKSACFQKGNGKLTCITCHDPHNIPRGEEAARHYIAVCEGCHGAGLQELISSKRHTTSKDCLGCHMPKRRTEDVVHVVMTDHFIQRFKPQRDLLAPLSEKHERYRGEVAPYYPRKTTPAAEEELYHAVAQVKENANLERGIGRLAGAIERHRPSRGEFYFELAEAHLENGAPRSAVPLYREALRRQPDLWPAQHKLGVALGESGQLDEAAEALRRAADMATDATALNDLALIYQRQGKLREATQVLRRAIELDADFPQAHNNLAGILIEAGDHTGAEAALRNAIRARPDFAATHYTLANLLGSLGEFQEARYHFEKVLKLTPDSGLGRQAREALAAIKGFSRE